MTWPYYFFYQIFLFLLFHHETNRQSLFLRASHQHLQLINNQSNACAGAMVLQTEIKINDQHFKCE